MWRLLDGAEKIDKDVFVKRVNYMHALRDFYKVNPKGVKDLGDVSIKLTFSKTWYKVFI